MDLDAYINNNIDDIISNTNDYIGEYIIDKNIKNSNKYNHECLKEDDNNSCSDQSGMYDDELAEFENYSEEEYFQNDNNLNENEDDDTQDIIGDLYQNMYEKNNNTELNNSTKNDDDGEHDNDNGFYYYNLINIFIKYYNNKFDKIENFFVGVKDINKDTSNQMELFFDAIIEYKIVKEKLNLDDFETMKIIYNNTIDSEKILELFDKCSGQIYSLEYNDTKYISPSLVICLNYIYENKISDEYWDIYTMRNIE